MSKYQRTQSSVQMWVFNFLIKVVVLSHKLGYLQQHYQLRRIEHSYVCLFCLLCVLPSPVT